MKLKKLKFYIAPNGLYVKLGREKQYLVSGVRAFPIVDIATREKRHVLIFN